MPVGRGRLLATELVCGQCGGRSAGHPDRYSGLIPADNPDRLSADDILRRTNPRLLAALVERGRLEENARAAGELAPGGADPRAEHARARLSDLGPRVRPARGLLARLDRWDALSAEARAGLLAEVDAVVGRVARRAEATGFVLLMAQQCPTNPGLITGVVILVLLAAAGIWAVFRYVADDWLEVGLTAAVALAAVPALAAMRWVRRRRSRQFIAAVVPECGRRGLRPADVVAAVRVLGSPGHPQAAALRPLVAALPMLEEGFGVSEQPPAE